MDSKTDKLKTDIDFMRSPAIMSSPVFEPIWDNPEDAVYDLLPVPARDISAGKLLLLAAILAYCGVMSGAQDVSGKAKASAPTTYQTPHDSREQVPLVGGSTYTMGQPTKVTFQSATTSGKIAMLAPPSKNVCYAMRSYNYVQDGVSPDAIKLKDSTTCEPAASGRMKSATAHR